MADNLNQRKEKMKKQLSAATNQALTALETAKDKISPSLYQRAKEKIELWGIIASGSGLQPLMMRQNLKAIAESNDLPNLLNSLPA